MRPIRHHLALAGLTLSVLSATLPAGVAHADSSATTLTATLRADLFQGVGAAVEVRVNGQIIKELQVDATHWVTFDLPLTAPLAAGDVVDIRFTNDAWGGGEDRNLYVASVSNNGHSIVPSDSTAKYDLGSTWSEASDGRNLMPASQAVYSNGSLRITWDKGAPSQGITEAPVPVSSSIQLEDDQVLKNRSLPGRQVWGHDLGYGLPDWDQLDGAQYGASYFLDMVHGDVRTPKRAISGVARAQAAGLTGMQILQNRSSNGTDFVMDWFKSADPTWTDQDANNDFSIAPVMANTTAADFVRMATNYVKMAANHPSAAKVDGRYVIYAYGSRYNMTAQDWAAARAQLLHAGVPVFVIGDLCEDVVWHDWKVPAADIAPYLPYWDATWVFETETAKLWPQISALLNEHNTAYAGGIEAGYNRESAGEAGASIDPEGTAKFRREWETSLAAGLSWQNIVTWDDLAEDTQIRPTSNWSSTRSDINAFYSAKLRGLAFPQSSAQLYVTTPQAISIGEPVKAEGMVLNSTSEAVTVRTRLVDGEGNPWGREAVSSVLGGSSGDATTASLPVSARPAGGFFRAITTSYDTAGHQLQTVTSAPVLVYGVDDHPTSDFRRTYYSIPARLALTTPVTLTLSGSPSENATASATVATSGPDARFLEVLQNTRLVQRGYSAASLTAGVPMHNGSQIVGGQTVVASPHGYYVGRVIDEQERVAYSDPVYVP